jgi:hypothetical protein
MENLKSTNDIYYKSLQEAQHARMNIESVLTVNKSRDTGCDSNNSLNEADCNEGGKLPLLLSESKNKLLFVLLVDYLGTCYNFNIHIKF